MRLLVSPTSVEEAVAAANGGADIIDVKNPKEGSLGASFPWIIKEIKSALPPGTELSATLGDLDFKPGTAALAAFGLSKLGVDYIKAGLYGVKTKNQAKEIARAIANAVDSSGIKFVLASYAEYKEMGSVSPMILPSVAADVGAFGVMIDTARKNGSTLLDKMKMEKLKVFVKDSHDLGLTVALAGSLGFEEVSKLVKIAPDIIGVRTLVCNGDRLSGKISEEKVRILKAKIQDMLLGPK